MGVFDGLKVLRVYKEIAEIKDIGIKGALIISQIKYWIDEYEKKEIELPPKDRKHFHNGMWWVFNTYDEWSKQLGIPKSTIVKDIGKLEDMGVIISDKTFNEKGYDRTKWYTLSENVLESLLSSHLSKMETCNNSNWIKAFTQNDNIHLSEMNTTIPKNTTKNTTENTTEITGKRDFFSNEEKISPSPPKETECEIIINMSVVKSLIGHSCTDLGDTVNEQLYFDIIRYFVERYKAIRKRDHPFISQSKMNDIIKVFSHCVAEKDLISIEYWQDTINGYFETKFDNCDYKIFHFASEYIIENRIYEKLL